MKPCNLGFALLCIFTLLSNSLVISAKHAKSKQAPVRDVKDEDDDDDDDDDDHIPPPPSRGKHSKVEEDNTIEDVDEDKIDEIVHEADVHLVIIFYEGSRKCPGCSEAMKELEEIDDDLEATGYIEVVKTDDKHVALEYGITTYPSLIYVRRKNPILYDGDFSDSELVLKWIRSHEFVATEDLDDNNFEDKTDSASPNEGALDWMVMFYDSKKIDCNAFVPVLETVAHRLRGLVHVGKVDIRESDDVAERFKINDDDECPTFLLLHRGKLYRYKDSAKDTESLTSFALHRYKEQRGHRVPEPPTFLEDLYEDIKEEFGDLVDQYEYLTMGVAAGAGVFVLIFSIIYAVRSFKAKKKED